MTDISEFRPIHPNITDVSMIDDIDLSKKKSSSNSDNVDSYTITEKQTKQQPQWQKTVFISILVVCIVVLCIMLLYQLYKYYIVEEQNTKTEQNKKTEHNSSIEKHPNTELQPTTDQQHVKANNEEVYIPDNVNNLNNEFLERYIKKPVELTPVVEVDSLLEEHNNEMDINELKIEDVCDIPVRELNKCTFVTKKRGKKNTTCGKQCVEELCDDHKS